MKEVQWAVETVKVIRRDKIEILKINLIFFLFEVQYQITSVF